MPPSQPKSSKDEPEATSSPDASTKGSEHPKKKIRTCSPKISRSAPHKTTDPPCSVTQPDHLSTKPQDPLLRTPNTPKNSSPPSSQGKVDLNKVPCPQTPISPQDINVEGPPNTLGNSTPSPTPPPSVLVVELQPFGVPPKQNPNNEPHPLCNLRLPMDITEKLQQSNCVPKVPKPKVSDLELNLQKDFHSFHPQNNPTPQHQPICNPGQDQTCITTSKNRFQTRNSICISTKEPDDLEVDTLPAHSPISKWQEKHVHAPQGTKHFREETSKKLINIIIGDNNTIDISHSKKPFNHDGSPTTRINNTKPKSPTSARGIGS